MAKGNVNPNPSPSPNPAPNPGSSTPSPTGTGGGGPTGNSGFGMNESSMTGLQNKAGDLGSRLSGISSGLRGLNFSGNALGPIGLFAVPALNASNDHAVSQADKGSKAFTDVQSNLKATHQTAVQTDSAQQKGFQSFDSSTSAKPPPGNSAPAPNTNTPGGSKVSGAGSIHGGGGPVSGGAKGPGGPSVSTAGTIKGGGGPVSGGPKTTGGPSAGPAPNIKGGGGPVAGGPKGGAGGPSVGTTPNIKGGGGPVGTGGVNTSGGPAVGTTPNVKGGGGPVAGGPKGGVGGPSVGVTPNVKGGGPVAGGPKGGVGGPSLGATPNVKGGAGPVGTGGVKGPGGPGAVAPPVIGGTPGAPGSSKPGGGVPGGKGGAIPNVPGGGVPGGKGVTPGAAGGPKSGVTPPGPQSAVTSPSTGGGRGTTPPGASPGMAPPMAPGGPGAQSGERGGSKVGTGGAKGVFDAPKPGTPNSTISKPPPSSTSTPPPAPKPGTPGVTPPAPVTPGAGGAKPGSVPPGSVPPGSVPPGAGSAGGVKPGVPGTPSTPGPQSAVTAPTQGTGPRGGLTPGATPASASPGAAAPPMAPGGANPGAAAGGERGGSKFGTGPGKGVFDAPKPPTPDSTISRAPGTSPSTPPPAPKPTPLTPPPAANVSPAGTSAQPRPAPTTPPVNTPGTNTPGTNTPPPAQSRPAPTTPPVNTPGTNTPGTNTPPSAQSRPAPTAPPVNAPGTNTPGVNTPPPAQTRPAATAPPVNAPGTNTPGANTPSPNTPPPVQSRPAPAAPPVNVPSPAPAPNTPSPRADTTLSAQPPRADTAPPVQSRPAPAAPPVNTPSPNTPPVNTPKPDTTVPPANTPKPDTNAPPVQTRPTPDTNTPPPAQTRPAPAPPVNAPPANVPPANVPPANVPPTNVPPTNVPPANAPAANTPNPTNAPGTNVPGTNVPPTNAPSTNAPNPGDTGVKTRPAPGTNTNVPPAGVAPNSTTNPNAAPDLVIAPPVGSPAPNPNQNASTSANPSPAPNVVPRSNPAAANYQAQTRPDGGKGKKRAAIKKYLGINFIKGLLNKGNSGVTPAPAPNVTPNPAPSTSTAPPNPWTNILKGKVDANNIDVPAVKAEIDTAVNDGKPASARILINRLQGTPQGAELQAHYDAAVAAKGDAGKVDVPKQLNFAWFGNTPSPDSVNGMLEWAAQTNENNGWKATLWTDGSSANWDPDVKQQLADAGIEINSDVDSMVNDLSNSIPPTAQGTTLNDVYAAAQNPGAKAYNLASDIARYAVLAKNGGVYVDVDIKPGSVSLDNIGDMKMNPTDVPVIGPRLRDTKSVQNALGDPDAQLTPENVQAAADIRSKEGELGNAFIVTPPNGQLITKFAEVIPQKFDTLNSRVAPENLSTELKNQAPDISGPNALADNGLAPQIGLIGQVAMDPNGLNLGFNPGYMPTDVPAIQKTDFQAMFDPDVKNQWNGLEWVTPESEVQLDADGKPGTDDNDKGKGTDRGGSSKDGNQDSSRPGRGNDAPPPPPPSNSDSNNNGDSNNGNNNEGNNNDGDANTDSDVDSDADVDADVDAGIDPEVVAEVKAEIGNLTTDAMQNADQKVKDVESALQNNPDRFVYNEAGLDLLRSSVVLDTRTPEIAALIEQHGAQNVAEAFRQQFNRPIIEGSQIEAFNDPKNGQQNFTNWAHQLWGTVDNTPKYQNDPDALASDIFDHEKGYNRATNFAQEAAFQAMVNPDGPTLSDAVQTKPAPAPDNLSQGSWVLEVLGDANLVTPGHGVDANTFAGLAADPNNRPALESVLGPLPDSRIEELKAELLEWGMLNDPAVDDSTDTQADTGAPATNAPGTSQDNQPGTSGSRGAPPASTPPPAPPAPPAPPTPGSDTKPDATKQVRSGGAPPAMTPPTPESHQGKDVITDESWRHDPAKTADWSTPNNPADRSTWADRRNDKDVRTVDVVVHDVRTDSTPSDIKSYQGLINYDLRRIETSPGNFVQEYTVKVHIDPAANVDPDVVTQVKDNASNGVNSLLNQGFRLPSGDQFHLNLEFTENAADAHTTIKVDPDNQGVDQTNWNPDASPEVLAHETLHYLGIPDEYSDSSRVFQQHDTNTGVHQNDGGLMGADVHLPDPGIRPRHLWLIERTANSQVMVPDTTLNPPGPATVPPPAAWTPPGGPDTTSNHGSDTSSDAGSNADTDTRSDADTRQMPPKRRFGEDSDLDSDSDSDVEADAEPTTKKPKYSGAPFDPGNVAGPSTVDNDAAMDVDQPSAGQNADTQNDGGQNDGDVDMDAQNDSQMDDLTSALNELSLTNVSYNQSFADLANGGFDLPTKDNYLAKLKESVEGNKPPSFVVNMIVNHNQLGELNSVIDAITADAGPKGKDMVFVVGVNGREGANADMGSHIETANNSVANRKEPIALVPLSEVKKNESFPFGKMRNETMHNPATTFAVGAMNGKGTHPYLSFQDFDSGSRQVPSPEGAPPKDIFNHFTESLNPPGAGPIRPLLYSGGYRVGDPNALIKDTKDRIKSERDKINAKDNPTAKDKKKLESLKTAEKELSKPGEFVARFEQAMRDDMDARSRQKDSAPMLPYSPEPNLFMDANVAVVDPDVKFGPGGNEFGDLSKSINKFAGNEIVDIHTNQLPAPDTTKALTEAKAQLEADIAARGGEPNPKEARALAEIDAELRANQDPAAAKAAGDALVDSAIDVDLQNNTNPLRGENFSTDFVNGAVATDLSRLALGFAESAGKKWPQSHVALTNPTSRMYSGPTPDLDRAAKADVSGAKIRDEFTEKFDRKGNPKPDNKTHSQREAQQVVEHKYDYDPETGVSTHTESKGGWTPSKLDGLHLGWEDKNSLDGGISAPVDGHGHIGIDPEVDSSTNYPPPMPKDSKGKRPEKTEADVPHIDTTAKQHKMAAMLNLAMSSNPSNITRTFGTLEAGVLPIAADPRPDGMFNAVQTALGDTKSATDLRAGAVQQGWTASPAITKQIANFRQEHGLENGHIVNAMIEPGPAPRTELPASFRPGSGDVAVDNTVTDPDWTPVTQAEAETHAQENAAEQQADNAKAAKAEELAAKLLATEIGRPITIHGPDGVQTHTPFFEPAPEITPSSKPAEVTKAKKWKAPEFPPAIELDARPNANGKTTFTPHTPSNDLGEGPSRRGPGGSDPGPSRGGRGPSNDGAPGSSTRPAPPAPDVQTRPAPPKPTPNPVVPMVTLAPQPVGQVPDTNLPSFFQNNQALGSITPTDVRGADAVVGEIQGLKPNDQARIKDALENDFETFLGGGRNFQVKIGNAWFEANIRAEMNADATTAVKDAADTKVDKNFQAAAASTTTNTIATSNDVGGSATAGVAMGPYGSLGGKAALATPAVSQATTNTITEQRAIKSDGGSKQVTVPVSYAIVVTDASGNPTQFATLSTGPDVTLQVPTDLSTIVDSGKTSDVVTPADAEWGTKVENTVPEAVVVKDSGQAFTDVAEKLHPSITKIGAPGREVLQNFLSPTSIRNNLPAMLGGFVTSPDLVSPHASKGGAVQMTATLKDAKLVGTHDKAVLDLKDTSAWGSSVSSSTKTGFDATAGFGGNIGVPGQVGGTVGATATYSARTAEGVSAGSSTNRKTGIGVKNETGLYEVTAEVEVRTPSGESVKMEVTTHMRMGLNEAGAVGLPTPDGSRNTITDPATADTKYLPPYVADTLAAGNAKVGEFTPSTKVQGQVEGALRELPGFDKFLPKWNNPDANPRSGKGQSFADVAEQLANQRKLTANLSPAALKANMDSLLGPGVQVQLKNSGKTTNTYVNVTVKAKVSNPKHLGQADARPVSDSTTTGPKLDANTSTTKGWTGGVQGRVNIPVKTGIASLTPMPQAGVSYNHSWTDKTSAGPAVSSTSSNPGSADAQVFQQDVEFEVEITTFTRPRTWVRNIVPGAPGFHSPQPRTVAKTGAGLDKIDGKVNLWVSDGSTLKNDPGDGFKPGDPTPTKIDNSPTVKDLLNPKDPRPKSPEFLHVEAVANTTALRDQAIDALNRAAKGDSALTTPGTAARAQIDKMFTPENIKANLQKLIETGVQEQGLKYDRRVTDRSGAIGMSVKLGDAKLVSISDTTGADNSVSGGYKAGESSSTSRSVDVTAGINIPVRPNVTPPPAGTPSNPSGSGGAAVTGKVTPWSDSKTESNEIGGNVDRGRTTPGDARTVLVQIDAEFTIVGESRAGNFVHGGTPNAEGVTVNMPKSVFVRVSEDVARELGVLPKVESSVPKPDLPKMAPPSTVAVGEPGALGLSNVESVPNLSGVVNDLTAKLATNTKKFGSDSLIPDSVLKDSMSNLQRIVDLNSPASVKAMIDSAMDGGVPLLVHQPGTFGKDSYQVTLRAKAGEPKFDQVVNDGVDMTHNNGGSRKESSGQGRGSGWSAGIRAPGLASPGSANPNVSGTAGAAVGANIGGSTSSSVTTSTTEAFSNTRTASGPAAQYTVPVEFELVVEKGSKEIAKAESGKQEMVVRTHADNQKVSQPTSGRGNPQPYMSAASKRGSEFGTPEATFAFQQDSRASQLPTTASVENLRGAGDLRDAAVKAMTEAGAGKGLTGKGTGSLNSLFSTLSPENLQPHLPSMLSGSLDVPGLKEAALTFGQDADVKVYAKLVNPQLGSLSDSVKIETPLTTKTTDTSSEAKVSETADVSVGLAQGSAAVKQGAPADTVNFGTGGVELRHAGEDSSANSGGPAQAEGGNIKPEDTPRTGLVQFDVEYRVVATIGGKTGVVDLTVPGSAGVRMPASEVETMLDQQFSDSLKDAQTDVKKAADDWRTAEKDVEAARHEAQDAINEAAAVLARTDQPIGDAATALNTAIDAHLDAEAKIPALEAAAAGTQAEVARTRATIQELNPQITSLSQDALTSKDALDDAQVNGAPQAELDRLGQEADAAHTALTDAQQQLTEAHTDLDAQRKAAADARAELQAQQKVVADAEAARTSAEQAHQKLADERAAAEKSIKDAETKLDDARRTADTKQQEWWDAKAKVDREVDSFNTASQTPPPVPPKPQPSSSTTTDTTAGTTTSTTAETNSGGGLDQKPLPPLPPESSVAETSRSGAEASRSRWNASDLVPDSLKSQSMLDDQAARRQSADRQVQYHQGRVDQLVDNRDAALTAYALRLPADPDAHGWRQFSDSDVAAVRAHVEQQVRDARSGGHPTGHLTDFLDFTHQLQEDRGQQDADPDVRTRPAPQPPQAPATTTPDTTSADTDTQAPTSVPDVVVESHLQALTADAMLNASPLAKQVETALRSDPDRYVQSEAGLDLLRASVVLDAKADDIAVLIERNGVEPVARAFNKEFGRPIIESAQLRAFGDISSPAGRAAFDSWAHQLWGTVNNTPAYQANPGKLAADIFNHDKGYNRGTNFAQEAAFADVMGAQPLSQSIADTAVYGPDSYSQALWTHKVLSDAQIIPSDSLVGAQAFTQAVNDNRAALEPALGVTLTPDVVADLKAQLQGDGMVDDDPSPSAPPADAPSSNRPPADPSPLHSTETSAPWFDPRTPVSSQAIADARATTPASSWVRGEDGGVLDSTEIGPHGINMQAWRGPIAYDNRVLNVDGVPVRDFTVRLHLNNGNADVQDRTRAGVEEMFNQGHRLPGGEQFHVTVEFTDNPADAHATVDVTDDPDGRANQLTWPAHTDSRRLAHEVGHFLGLRDEYLETGDVKPIFQHQDGRGRVVNDNSPMTQGIDRADAQLKPRHLQLVEDRMKALASHNEPKPVVDNRSELPAPNMPKRGNEHLDAHAAGDAVKRTREDLAELSIEDNADGQADSDVEMSGQEAESAGPVELVNENGVHNAAFENLANGRTLTPITAANYLDRTRQSIANNEPPAFVVSMIVRAGELDQLDSVINGVMANASNMNGRVAFVLGVNAATQADIDTAIAAAAPVVNGHAEPIALVSVPHGPKGFKFGETRNSTLDSNAHEFAVTALAANGTHPYVSVMDFDAGDRRTRQGGHVFDHVTQLMDAHEVGPADGPDVPAPLRPLMVGGGYRVTVTPQQLQNDVLTRIDNDTKTNDAQKQAYRAKLAEQGFTERFEHAINADMHARRNQQGIHPLLPYTPEPNLFIDGLVPLADPAVRFGEGQAEFGQLGQSLNRFYARELAKLHTPADPALMAEATEQARVDVQNNRHPVRGQAFTTDFVAGDTGTDLSRIAYGLIKDGKLPQSHTALPNVSERFFDGKSSKAGTKFADERERLATGPHATVEPFRTPAPGTTTGTWNPPKKMTTQLGAPAKNKLNPAVSAPLPAPFNDQQAGIQKDQKVVAAHGLVASDHVSNTQRQLRFLNEDVLVRQPVPPVSNNGLYAAIAQARGLDPAALRGQVINLAATHQAVTRAVADWTVSRPMHQGHMNGALVENANWHMQADGNENAGAGNARDLVAHLIATQLSVNVRIHQGGAGPVLIRPMGPPFEETVDLDLVMDGRQVTYRPRPGLQPDVPMH
jgi:hypothetical protein